jgi:hypothetical protein
LSYQESALVPVFAGTFWSFCNNSDKKKKKEERSCSSKDVMLSTIVDAVNPECLDELLEFTGAGSHSARWRKLANRVTKYKVRALPTLSITRWYSHWTLFAKAEKTKGEVDQWLERRSETPVRHSQMQWKLLKKNLLELFPLFVIVSCSSIPICDTTPWQRLATG